MPLQCLSDVEMAEVKMDNSGGVKTEGAHVDPLNPPYHHSWPPTPPNCPTTPPRLHHSPLTTQRLPLAILQSRASQSHSLA